MENSRIKQKLALRKLVQDLNSRDVVSKVTQTFDFLKVKFQTGITEYWALNDKALKKRQQRVFRLPEQDYFTKPIQTFKQFETNTLDDNYQLLKDHFLIKRKDIKAAGWCDVRCKIHELVSHLVLEGWIDVKYPDYVLKQDLEHLKNEDLSHHQSSLIRYSAFGGQAFGRRLVLHHIPTLAKENWKPYDIYRALNQLFGGMYDVTREFLVYRLTLNYHKIRFPGFFRAFFGQWYSLGGRKVLDLYPDMGFKALGIMVDGGHYTHVNYDNSSHLAKMADFINGNISPHKLGNKYDIALISDVHPISLEELDERINKYKLTANNLVVVVSNVNWREAMDRYKPWRCLRIQNKIGSTAAEDNYILIIGQR
jgi:hypothetical protein